MESCVPQGCLQGARCGGPSTAHWLLEQLRPAPAFLGHTSGTRGWDFHQTSAGCAWPHIQAEPFWPQGPAGRCSSASFQQPGLPASFQAQPHPPGSHFLKRPTFSSSFSQPKPETPGNPQPGSPPVAHLPSHLAALTLIPQEDAFHFKFYLNVDY